MNITKSAFIFLMCGAFILGFGIGNEETSAAELEIIKLNIELTKLQIKKLRGANG